MQEAQSSDLHEIMRSYLGSEEIIRGSCEIMILANRPPWPLKAYAGKAAPLVAVFKLDTRPGTFNN